MTFLPTQGCGDSGGGEHGVESVLLGFARAFPGEPIDGVVGDEIDLGVDGSCPLGQEMRLGDHVIHIFDEDVLERDVLLALGAPVLQRVEQLGEVVLLIHRHDAAADFVAGAMQGDGEADLHRKVRELADLRREAAGAHGHVPRTDADAPFGIQDLDGLGQVGVVRQRLAHAHKDEIVHALTGISLDLHDLLDDLRRREIAGEAREAAGAKFAVIGAADLAGDAERAAVGITAIERGIRGDEHGLDIAPVVELEQKLPRRVLRASDFGDGHAARHIALG